MTDTHSILAAVEKAPTQAAYWRAWQALQEAGPPADALPCRVAILADFTVQPLVACLGVEALKDGLALDVWAGDFGQVESVLTRADHALHAHRPELVFVLLDPCLRFENWAVCAADETAQVVQDWVGPFLECIGRFLETYRGPLVCSNLVDPAGSPLGILAPERDAFRRGIRAANDRLEAAARATDRLHLLDLRRVVGAVGTDAAFDPRMRVVARMPYTHTASLAIAREMCRFLRASRGLTRKCLVLDLDNTLWGGVVGEDGPDGIQLGDEAPGLAYKQFQRVLKAYKETGVLLALCSRNNLADVEPVLASHREMILRPPDFAAVRINWNSKADNLRELAADLNIGLESMVFVDDEVRERELVRQALPEVAVLDLPPDPALYAQALLEHHAFDKLALTAEDKRRTALYREEKARADAQQSAGSFEAYLHSLRIRATVRAVDDADFPRVHQLVGKTNQFNLTTIRYPEAELRRMLSNPAARVYALRVQDRFGDSGLTGVAVLKFEADTCVIETLLLSCRILGRTIETAFLAFLAARAAERGAARLLGRFRPTPKNRPAASFYGEHGFSRAADAPDGGQTWERLFATQGAVACPPWIELTAEPA
ncbi:MAG: HAD-IIIC family phosphatase [Kiritimatiellae bacterium]|nr:HAD-IIIC family phosphatase [Kiritimatiellia bacterium]